MLLSVLTILVKYVLGAITFIIAVETKLQRSGFCNLNDLTLIRLRVSSCPLVLIEQPSLSVK